MTWSIIFPIFASPILGAFLVEAAYRLAAKRALVGRPASCDECHVPLSSIDLIPLFGWLMQKGSCRHCGERIGFGYTIGELAAVAAAVAPIFFDLPVLIHVGSVVLAWYLVFVSIVDIKSGHRLRDYCLPLIVVGFIVTWIQQPEQIMRHGLAAVLGYCFFWTVNRVWLRFRDRRAAGLGDFFFAAAVGAWLGPKYMVGAIMIGMIFSAIFALVHVIVRRKKKKLAGKPSEVTLVPGMAIGLLVIWLQLQSLLVQGT